MRTTSSGSGSSSSGGANGGGRDPAPSDDRSDRRSADGASGDLSADGATDGGFDRFDFARLLLVVVALFAGVAALRSQVERVEEDDDQLSEEGGVVAALPGGRLPVAPNFEPRSTAESVVYDYLILQLELSRSRNHRRTGETPREHGARFHGRSEAIDGAFDLLHGVLYDALYGVREVTDEDARSVRTACTLIRRKL